MSILTRRVVLWAAQECAWQQSGELSVGRMVDAWFYAHRRRFGPVSLADVLELGRIVEPGLNRNGVREVGVRVGWDVKMPPNRVPVALEALIKGRGYPNPMGIRL